MVKNYESVGSFKKHIRYFQPKFYVVLLCSLRKAVKGLVISECRAGEHDLIELVAERAAELAHRELRLS